MKFQSPFSSPCPLKEALREEIRQQTAVYEATVRPVQTSPLRAMSNDGVRTQDGKVQLTIVNKRKWNV